jgi:hypothetical protein
MLTRNEKLESLCCTIWSCTSAESGWGDTSLFEEIGGGETIVQDWVNEGSDASDGVDLIELGAKLATSPEPHVVVNVDGYLSIVFQGDPDELVAKATVVAARLDPTLEED